MPEKKLTLPGEVKESSPVGGWPTSSHHTIAAASHDDEEIGL